MELTKPTLPPRTSGSAWLKELARQQAEAQIEAGYDSPLELYIHAKLEIVQAEGRIEGLKTAALDEAFRYGAKTFTLAGATVTRTMVGGNGRIDYAADDEWRRLKQQLVDWEGRLQSLDEPTLLITCEGEPYTASPLPPRMGSYESISVSFNVPSREQLKADAFVS